MTTPDSKIVLMISYVGRIRSNFLYGGSLACKVAHDFLRGVEYGPLRRHVASLSLLIPVCKVSLPDPSGQKDRRCFSWWGISGGGSGETLSQGGRDELARKEEEVLSALSKVYELNANKDVVHLQLVQDLVVDTKSGMVTFTLRLPTMALPGSVELTHFCKSAVEALDWVSTVEVNTKTRRPQPRTPTQANSPGLSIVENIICVSSCKGGVGKSTVAVNLAYALAERGARVGLLDADVYGPSLPTLVKPTDVALRVSPSYPERKLLSPVLHRGVACMSFGWVNPKAKVPGAGGRGAAVMRGPIVSKVINQLLLGTDWGELEYLVIDMPPGTGDIQITLCQSLQMTGAVVVTTPQKLSYVDVIKGIGMFEEVKVPVLAVVENMSYFDCDHGKRHFPFGPGHADRLLEECGVESNFRLPLSAAVASGSDSGDPIVLASPGAEESEVYLSLADAVVAEVFRGEATAAETPEVIFKPGRGIVMRYMSETEATELVIPPYQLRIRDPVTGDILPEEEIFAVDEEVIPLTLGQRGNYAVAISWSDGNRGNIYAHRILRKVAEEMQGQS